MADKPPSPNPTPSNPLPAAETKSGQTFEYGNTDDSKIEAQGKSIVRLWAVNKITDASNNAINYIYNEDKARGEYILQRINYGNNSVRLTYADRNDTHTSYLAGSKLQQTKRYTRSGKPSPFMSINIEDSPFPCVGRFFQLLLPPRLACHCLPLTPNDASSLFHLNFVFGRQHGLPDRVFDRNPKTNQTGLFVYLNTGNGFDNGKQWQSNLGGNENNIEDSPFPCVGRFFQLLLPPRLACHCLPLTPNDASSLFHLNFVFGRQRPLLVHS
jgi:hypothetical protein